MLNKKALFLIICCVGVMGFIIAGDLISEDNNYSCKDNLCYQKSIDIDFQTLGNGFSFNGIEVTSTSADGITIIKEKDTRVTSKIQFIPEITKDSSLSEVEYKFNIQPDKVTKVTYFPTPDSYLDYIGAKNFDEVEKICEKENKCSHKDYVYYIFKWTNKNIKLNTKKIDLLNGDYYNIERTKTGFKVTGLEGKTSLTANDVITSGGELWINGQSNCSEFFNYVKSSAPECMYLNQSKDLTNLTSIDLKCKVHMNASEFKCDGYSINWIQDEMVDIDEALFIHSHSRMNMSNGELKLSFSNASLAGRGFILAYDSDLINHSQYFTDFTIRTDSRVALGSYMNVTGDGLDFMWSPPSGAGAIIGGPSIPPALNGVGRGVFLKGDSINFPLDITGLVNGDMSEATAGGGMCFFVWLTGASINLKGGKWICNGDFFFGGELFSVNKYVGANFTNLDITLDGASVLVSSFFSEGTIDIFNTQTYTINSSETDEPVTANITVYNTENNGNFPDIVYNNITSLWNIPVKYYHYSWFATTTTDSDYTARMIIENSSYFSINSSLDITEIQNGKKDMVKIPYYYELDLNSDTGIQLF